MPKLKPSPALLRAITTNSATGNLDRLVYSPRGLSKKQLTSYNKLVVKLNNEEITKSFFQVRTGELLKELEETQQAIIRNNFVSNPKDMRADKADLLNHFYCKHDKLVSAFFVLDKIAAENQLSLAVVTVTFSKKVSEKLKSNRSPASAYSKMIAYLLHKLQLTLRGGPKGLVVIESSSAQKEKIAGAKAKRAPRLHAHILTVLDRTEKKEALKLFRKHTDNHKNSVVIQFENIIKRPLLWQDELDEEFGVCDSDTSLDYCRKLVIQKRRIDLGAVDYFSKLLGKKLSNFREEKRNYSLIGITKDVNVNHNQRSNLKYK